jgi:hypothetical protein
MKPLPFFLALALPALAGAQSPLSTLQITYPASTTYIWTGCPSPNLYFNLVVNTAITIQGLDVALNAPLGPEGTVEVYITNPGITTYVGNELNQSMWTLSGTGSVASAGFATPGRVTLNTGIQLQPGTYGVAIRYIGIRPLFWLGNGTAVPGGGGPSTNQYFQNAELTLLAGTTQGIAFASPAFTSYVWLGSIHYALGAVPHTGATNVKYGSGCYTAGGSFYQRFSCSGPTPATLNTRSLSLTYLGGGYALSPGPVAYIAPTAAAAALPAQDEGETPISLTNPMIYPGGATQTLFVNHNGIISVAANSVPSSRFPSVLNLLNVPQTAWFSWHDYDPAEQGSGLIKFEEVGTLAIFTWDDVESRPGTPAGPVTNRCTFQIQFDTATGNVNYVWQSMSAVIGSNTSDDHIIGFSPGGPSPDTGPIDITTFQAALLTVPELLPLKLDASPSPVVGATVDYTTSSETGLSAGVLFLSVASLPGIDLGIIGAPGCLAHVDITQSVGIAISNLGVPGLSMTGQLPIPASTPLLGFQLFAQTVWLDATANPFGILTSNGVRSTVGSF